MTEEELTMTSDKRLEQLYTKLRIFTQIWRIVIASIVGTILGYIALLEHQQLVFALALLPFPIIFTLINYERQIEKFHFTQFKADAQNRLRTASEKQAR